MKCMRAAGFLYAMVFALLAWSTLTAQAAPVTFDVQNGTQSGFQYSVIHSADALTHTIDGINYYGAGAFGPSLYGTQMTGSLSGDLGTVGTQLQFTGINGILITNNGYTFAITGGSLIRETVGANQHAFGTLTYTLTGSGGGPGSAGTFHFHPQQFAGLPGPNSLNPTALYLWGNNWNNGVDPLPGAGRLGIDLHAVAAVPLPGALPLFGTGLVLLIGMMRRPV